MKWVVTSTVGLLVGLGAFFVCAAALLFPFDDTGQVADSLLGQGVAGAVTGASVGIAQWLILWRPVDQAAWWVLASTVGAGFAWAVIFVCLPVYGAITGGTLVWLLRQHIPDAAGAIEVK